MEYYLVIGRNEVLETTRMLYQVKETDTKDSIFIKCPEKAALWRQTVGSWLAGAGAESRECSQMAPGSSEVIEYALKLDSGNTSEFYGM